MGKLVNDDKLTRKLNKILSDVDFVIYELHTTTYALNHGEGTLPRLVHDKQMAQNIDTAVAKVDEAVVQVTRAAETVANSWIFRLFSKKKKEPKEQPVQEFKVQPGDTIVIDSVGAKLKQ